MEFFTENKAGLMFFLGVAMLVVILMRRYNRYFKRQKKQNRAASRSTARSVDPAQPLLDAPPEILRWQVEMHETARELKAELDSKISVLQTLIAEARQATAELEAAKASQKESAASTY